MGATVAVAGEMAIETSGLVTVNEVVPVMPEKAAEMVVVPALTAVANPEVLTLATAVLEESQLALDVRFFELPSL